MDLVRHVTDYLAQGMAARMRGALMVPDDVARVDHAAARDALLALVGGREAINLEGLAWLDGLELAEIPWGRSFRVPAREKVSRARRLVLVAGAPD